MNIRTVIFSSLPVLVFIIFTITFALIKRLHDVALIYLSITIVTTMMTATCSYAAYKYLNKYEYEYIEV